MQHTHTQKKYILFWNKSYTVTNGLIPRGDMLQNTNRTREIFRTRYGKHSCCFQDRPIGIQEQSPVKLVRIQEQDLINGYIRNCVQ